jgi:hypothetical protein
MKINIPRLRHKKLKDFGKNLHWATSATKKDPNPLENPGGSKNEYFLHDDPKEQEIIKNRKILDKLVKEIELKHGGGFIATQERLYRESLKSTRRHSDDG